MGAFDAFELDIRACLGLKLNHHVKISSIYMRLVEPNCHVTRGLITSELHKVKKVIK